MLRTLVCSGFGAVLFGGLMGVATVDGIRLPRAEASPIYPRAGVGTLYYDGGDGSASSCPGCTIRHAGARWSPRNDMRDADACGRDERGCPNHIRGGRAN